MSYKTSIKALSHQHTASIDSLDGSRFYTVTIFPEWLTKAEKSLKTPLKKILADCIQYRNSMAFQYEKNLDRAAM